MLNWVGFGFQCAATDFQLGADLTKIGSTLLQGAAQEASIAGNITASWSKEASYRSQAKSFETAAADAVKQAGRCQEQGRQSRESRLVKLGQDKGHIIAGAAGSGLDVTSSVVNKTMKDTIKSAFNDAAVIAENERQATQEKLNTASSMRINAIWAEHNANMEDINQQLMMNQMELSREATDNAVIGGALSAAGNFLGGMAGAGGALTWM